MTHHPLQAQCVCTLIARKLVCFRFARSSMAANPKTTPSTRSGASLISASSTIYSQRSANVIPQYLCCSYILTATAVVRKRHHHNDRAYLLMGPKIVLEWAWSAFKNLELFLTDPQCGLCILHSCSARYLPLLPYFTPPDGEILGNRRTHGPQKRERMLTLLDGIKLRASGLHSVFLSLLSRTDNTREGFLALQKKAFTILLFIQVPPLPFAKKADPCW